MTLVLNKAFGGFSLPNGFMEEYGYTWKYASDVNRDDPRLINWVSNNPNESEDLECVEIPNEATDYEIDEYDGFESVTYVVNGKLYHA